MEPDPRAAYAALTAYAESLPPRKPDDPFGRPEWLDRPAVVVDCYTLRGGHTCYVFALQERQNGVTGYVLDAETLAVQEVRDGQVALALARVGLEPAPGVGTPWRRRNHR